MFLKHIKSERGLNILVHEGFMYHFEKKWSTKENMEMRTF
jgi:hypothetical protein